MSLLQNVAENFSFQETSVSKSLDKEWQTCYNCSCVRHL